MRTSIRSRFIPAHAGNTASRRTRSRMWPVHPRSRGEHERGVLASKCCNGSSPLTRGTRPKGGSDNDKQRFIPAHAGNTSTRTFSAAMSSVHPRSRGEHNRLSFNCGTLSGSSPLTRGTRVNRGTRLNLGRFIPAHAGNTFGSSASSAASSVHPRSRGEHPAGRSPACTTMRFIPAHAGNTHQQGDQYYRPTVHPRSRGEHFWKAEISITPAGSSPLTRGTPPVSPAQRPSGRFIPAHAGNT